MGVHNGVELDDVTLTGDRLVLRRWQPADAEAVRRALDDEAMHEFLALPRPYTASDAHTFVTDIGHEGRGEGSGLGCAVVERASGELAGSAVLRLGRDPEVGYWIAPSMQGRGYAAEATRMLAAYGFETLGLDRVGLDCDVANLASARTALAAGFRLEGVARRGTRPGTPGADTGAGELARFGRAGTDDGLPIAPAFPPLPAEGLTDGVITLRPTSAADLTGMVETAHDPVTRRWDFDPIGLDEPELRRRAVRAGLDWLTGRTAPMTIVDVASGCFAGELSLRALGPPQTGAFGYGVHPAFRGRGYTTRALLLATRWAFDRGYAYLALGAKIDNIASQRAAERAGFTRTRVAPGILRNPDGTFSAEAQYELLAPAGAGQVAST